MIKLQVEDYCQNCPHFKPEVMSGIKQSDSPPYHISHDHVICCEHHERCEVVKIHYEEQRRINYGF